MINTRFRVLIVHLKRYVRTPSGAVDKLMCSIDASPFLSLANCTIDTPKVDPAQVSANEQVGIYQFVPTAVPFLLLFTLFGSVDGFSSYVLSAVRDYQSHRELFTIWS